jgi:hypothetical protein
MRAAFPMILIAVLAGCGSETGQDNHGYGYQYDQDGATGLRVRWAGTQVPSLTNIEQLYQETMACTGITATGPLVIITEPIPSSSGDVYGSVFLDTGTVFISSWLDTDIEASFWAYKHEFVHYLLHQSGFDVTANAAHQSPLFYSCTQPPSTLIGRNVATWR